MASFALSLKVSLISIGVLSIALLLKVSVPLVVDFSVYQAPVIWSSLVAWLRPPYLYVIINCIIITIIASSRFHHNNDNDRKDQAPPSKISVEATRQPDEFSYEVKASTAEIRFGSAQVESAVEVSPVFEQREEKERDVFEDKSVVVNSSLAEVEDKDEEDFIISRSSLMTPERMDSSENLVDAVSPAEKPLVSARFAHRKPVKAIPEGGRALRVLKPKRHETLENTWRMITEGRPMPLTRHLKKSDTWDNHVRHLKESPVDPSLVKKSGTFNDRTNYQLPPVSSNSPASGRLRKEPSLSQEELNRRVEAFIKKFNEDMRLQRQQSLNRYMEIANRGNH